MISFARVFLPRPCTSMRTMPSARSERSPRMRTSEDYVVSTAAHLYGYNSCEKCACIGVMVIVGAVLLCFCPRGVEVVGGWVWVCEGGESSL